MASNRVCPGLCASRSNSQSDHFPVGADKETPAHKSTHAVMGILRFLEVNGGKSSLGHPGTESIGDSRLCFKGRCLDCSTLMNWKGFMQKCRKPCAEWEATCLPWSKTCYISLSVGKSDKHCSAALTGAMAITHTKRFDQSTSGLFYGPDYRPPNEVPRAASP